ncbi:hypothetical protein EUX98_g9030 [Antrodiella citrinella]|uniref:Uncharacterized protein n=1 Tax=Antrodiella citrinella TaxID=2447956 RepID=A0A4V3XFL1_9APHY|nr:hypothetical protein EUX98_g9030 [Antrodiella citrinella]
MFKKPLSDLKTSAPLRSSDRRKLKQRIIDTHALTPEIGELLVPDGLLAQKFSTHLDEPGQVIQHTPSLHPNQLVAITQYHSPLPSTNPANPTPRIGPPLAVGHSVVSSDQLRGGSNGGGEEGKGKAVLVLHAWKDHLWNVGIGRKMEVPEPRLVGLQEAVEEDEDEDEDEGEDEEKEKATEDGPTESINTEPVSTQPATETVPAKSTLTPEDVSSYLRSALLQALSTTLRSAPPSAFPILASTFWTTHILPARPAQAPGTNGLADASAIDIRHSTYKSVKVFLKACAKEGLIKLKETRGDVMITDHPSVSEHRPHKTIASVEAKREKAEERERQEKEAEEKKKGEIQVTELWKPFETTVGMFVSVGKSSQDLYTATDIGDIFNAYVTEKGLINAREQQYINVGEDAALSSATSVKNEERPEFLKREEALQRVRDSMQSWHRVSVEGGDIITKKGAVKPIKVTAKIRQGRKTATLVTGFESFFLQADEFADELEKVCASSTSVSPLPGKASSDMEVMVQGKQTKAVTDFLMARGVPKKWIEVADLSNAKKK